MTTNHPGAGASGQGTSAGMTADRTRATGAESGGEVTGAIGAAVDQAKEKAGELVDQATEQAKPRLENQKERAADGLSSAAHALRQTSRHLREQEESSPIVGYTERAADRVERLADYLREREIGDLIGEVEDFARRQPVLFVGGAFTLGLLAARFLKSSGQRGTTQQGGRQQPIGGYLPAAGQTTGSRPRPTGAYAPPPVRPTGPQGQMPGQYPTAGGGFADGTPGGPRPGTGMAPGQTPGGGRP